MDLAPRDIDLAKQALQFFLMSPHEDRIANVALLFALARHEGMGHALHEQIKALPTLATARNP